MRDGLDGDDVWVMVEDEFLDTARIFTQHLHHAEYHRLKRLAQARNTSAIQNMSRPVDPRSKMSIECSKKREGQRRTEKQAKALQAMGSEDVEVGRNSDDSEDDATPWMFDPHLGGLMAGNPPSSSQQLAKLAGSKSNTRAAAGFQATKHKITKKPTVNPSTQAASSTKSTMHGLAQEIELAAASNEEDDSDDLDGPTLRRSSSKSVPPPSISSRAKNGPLKEQRKVSDPLLSQRTSSFKRSWPEEDERRGHAAFQKPRLADAATRASRPQTTPPEEPVSRASWRASTLSRTTRPAVASLWASDEDEESGSNTFQNPRLANASNRTVRAQPAPSEEPVSRASWRASTLSRTTRPSVASLWASAEDEPAKDNTRTQSPLPRRRRDDAKERKPITIDEIPTFLF